MKKSNQIQSVDWTRPAIPERVGVAMSEIAENMHEGIVNNLTMPTGGTSSSVITYPEGIGHVPDTM